VIKFKSFTTAAKELYLTQPTVSAHIHSLEEELDTKLIMRTTREVYPTKVGQVLFDYANQLLLIRQKAIDAVRGFERSMEGEITIGASSIPASYFLPKLISEFSLKNPKVSFNIEKSDSAVIIRKLENREIEIGIVGTLTNSKKCDFYPLLGDRLIIIAPNTLYYRTMFGKGYSIHRLMKEPFISREKGSGTRKESEYLLKEMGVDISRLNVVAEMDDNESIVRSVSLGLGVSVISDKAAEDFFEAKKILIFEMENSKRQRKFYLVRHKLNPLSPVSEEFYSFAQKYFSNPSNK
ncbi:MAG: selenium metabolism-associated LysR family transcriptional regulator, partial [Oscillospiraceae bacterium]